MRSFLLAFAFFLTVGFLSAAPGKTDAAIESDIRARLARSKIAANGFNVRVHNGTVIWTGTTEVIQHKGAATRMAKSAGAVRVDNRITIGARARAQAAQRLHRSQGSERKTERPASETKEVQSLTPASHAPPKSAEPTLAPPPIRRAIVRRP